MEFKSFAHALKSYYYICFTDDEDVTVRGEKVKLMTKIFKFSLLIQVIFCASYEVYGGELWRLSNQKDLGPCQSYFF